MFCSPNFAPSCPLELTLFPACDILFSGTVPTTVSDVTGGGLFFRASAAGARFPFLREAVPGLALGVSTGAYSPVSRTRLPFLLSGYIIIKRG